MLRDVRISRRRHRRVDRELVDWALGRAVARWAGSTLSLVAGYTTIHTMCMCNHTSAAYSRLTARGKADLLLLETFAHLFVTPPVARHFGD